MTVSVYARDFSVQPLTEVRGASGRAGAVAAVVHGRKLASAAHHEALSRLLEVLVGAINLCRGRSANTFEQ